MAIQSVNPSTGEALKGFTALTDAEIERKLARAEETYRSFRLMPVRERLSRLLKAAEILESGKVEWGRLMTLEMGKPLRPAIEETQKCAWACRYYAENAERFLAEQRIESAADVSFISF